MIIISMEATIQWITLSKINPSLSFYSKIGTMHVSKISKHILDLMKQIKSKMKSYSKDVIESFYDPDNVLTQIFYHGLTSVGRNNVYIFQRTGIHQQQIVYHVVHQ